MNTFVKFKVYSLKFKEMLRWGRGVRLMLLVAAMMLLGGMTAQAQWTDPSTGVTFTPISGSNGTGGEGWAKGCDGIITTKHGGQTNALPHNLVVQASQAVKLTGYTITTANDNSANTGRSPYTWKVQGSNTNNGSDWVDIATETQNSTLKNVNYIEYEFSCTTNNYYTYFRFYITAINGGNYMQYSEFHPIGETSGAYTPGTSGGGGTYGPNNVGYVITNGSVYLGGTSTTAINTFNPQTCLWSTTGTSNVVWRNTAGYNLYSDNNGSSLRFSTTNTRGWDLVGTESGTTGMRIKRYNNNNYVYLNGSAWATANTTAYIAFAATKTTHYATYTVPEIGGATEITALGVNNINTIATNAAYRQKYYDYIFRGGAHHYVDDDDANSLNSVPPASSFNYEWSLEGADGYATINSSNGQITYNNSTSSDLDVTVKLTATSAKKTFVVTKTVTLKPVRIYYQINATAEPSAGGKVYVGTSSGTPSNSTATISGNVLGSYPTTNFQPYLIAAANDGYEFKWWSTTSEGSSASVEATYRPTISLNLGSTTSGNADVHNYYAQFGLKPTFYFSATAVAGAGGTASVDPSTASVTGEHWNSTSATKSVTFTASANSGYEFVGWYSDAGYNTQVSTNSTYNATITSTSTNSGSPTNTTLYARFRPFPTAITPSPSSLTLCIGENEVFTYSLTPSDAYDNVTVTSGNSGIATVSKDGNTVTVTGVATGSTTITLKAKNSSGTEVCNNTVSVEIPTKWTTPTINFNNANNQVSIDAIAGATFYYTTDGSTPTTESTEYSAFTQNTPATIKAIAVGDGHCPSDVATFTLGQVATPTIKIESSGVTFTSETTGASFDYTVNSGSATTWNTGDAAITSFTDGNVISVVAKKSGMLNSEPATVTFHPASGVSGGTVYLNDLEDHNWTYYAGVSNTVDGGNYNTNYAGKLYSPNPRNVKITYLGNTGAVSKYESDTAFVYFKTLEESSTSGEYAYQVISNPFSKRPKSGNNFQGFNGWKIISGAGYIKNHSTNDVLSLDEKLTLEHLDTNYSANCISGKIVLLAQWTNLNNITYANDNTITYSVTGGNYETNILVLNRNVTGTITTTSPVTIMMVEPDGSTDYRDSYAFTGNITPNNNRVTKIEFTKWNSTNTVSAGFKHLWIGRGMTTSSQCASLVTGTTSTTSVASPQYSIKLESGKFTYVSFYKGYYNNTAEQANAGFQVSGNSANAVIVYGNDYDRAKGDNTNLTITEQSTLGIGNTNYSGFTDRSNRDNLHTLDMTIKSGKIGPNYFMENTSNSAYLHGGDYNVYLCSGGAKTNNGCRNLTVEGGDVCSIGGGTDQYNNAPSNNNTPSSSTNYNRTSLIIRIKGGTIHGNVFGGGAKSPAGGNRIIVTTGGTIMGWVAAGCNGISNDGGQTYGTSYVYIGGKSKIDSDNSPKVLGYANGGNVYAAGAGMQGATECGEMTFGTNLVIADECHIERAAYGGGNYGYAKTSSSTNIYITGGINDGGNDVANDVTSKGAVFGGSNQQDGPNINLYMTGGEMRGGVYGGCNTEGTISGNVTMNINGGQVGTSSISANVHGGGYGSSTVVSGNVAVNLGTCNATSGVTVYGDVYGGSALGTVNTNANNTTTVNLYKGTIFGGLYGGALGDLASLGTGHSNVDARVKGAVAVNVFGGSVLCSASDPNGEAGTGSVFGCNNVNGRPESTVNVNIYNTDQPESGYALHAVYGGGNKAAYNGTPVVTIHGCNNKIEYVYGGGNATNVNGTNVTIWGGTIGNAFGGGNGAGDGNPGANILADTARLIIHGGTIGAAFGGSNQRGYINTGIRVTVKAATESNTGRPTCVDAYEGCTMDIAELYGGGNEAPIQTSSGTWLTPLVQLDCSAKVGMLFGGAKAANYTGNLSLVVNGGTFSKVFGGNNKGGTITGNVTVTFNGGKADEVYGGCNESGTITGTITVNIDSTNATCTPRFYVGDVYGGGNMASYTHSTGYPQVNIINGTVRQNVYGGGFGPTATITGTPKVTIGGTNGVASASGKKALVLGNVFGGGNAAGITGNTNVNVINNSVVKGSVFGGGNAAPVSVDTQVLLNDKARVYGNIYGGGNQGEVGGNTKVIVNSK